MADDVDSNRALEETAKTMESSGKQPNHLVTMFSCVVGGVAAGVLGYVGIRLTIAFALMVDPPRAPEGHALYSGGGSFFSKVVRLTMLTALVIVIPVLMGLICKWVATRGTRKPNVAVKIALVASILAIASLISFSMYMSRVTLAQWFFLDGWLVGSGPHHPVSLFVHILPMGVLLFVSSSATYGEMIKPLCQRCNKRLDLECLQVRTATDDESIARLLQSDSFAEFMLRGKDDDSSGLITFYLCGGCEETGYLSLSVTREQEHAGKRFVGSDKVANQQRMTLAQVQSARGILETRAAANEA
jgi:hypothetical protein